MATTFQVINFVLGAWNFGSGRFIEKITGLYHIVNGSLQGRQTCAGQILPRRIQNPFSDIMLSLNGMIIEMIIHRLASENNCLEIILSEEL